MPDTQETTTPIETEEERALNDVKSRETRPPQDVMEKLIEMFAIGVNDMPISVTFNGEPYTIEIFSAINNDNVLEDLKFRACREYSPRSHVDLSYANLSDEIDHKLVHCVDGCTLQEAYDFIRGMELAETGPETPETTHEIAIITKNLRSAAGLPGRIYPTLDINEQVDAVVAKLKLLTDDWQDKELIPIKYMDAIYRVNINPTHREEDDSLMIIAISATPGVESGHSPMGFNIFIDPKGKATILPDSSEFTIHALTFIREARLLKGIEAENDRATTTGALRIASVRAGNPQDPE